jgi:hypothetical protein
MSLIRKEQIQSAGDPLEIYIEVEDSPPIAETGSDEIYGKRRAPELKVRSFEAAMTVIRQAAVRVVETVNGIAESARPSEVEVSFGVKFANEVGAFIAKTGVDASLNVKLKWTARDV